MSDVNVKHPSPGQLAAFELGRLGQAESVAIQSHLAACENCRHLMEALESDTLPPVAQAISGTIGVPPLSGAIDQKRSEAPTVLPQAAPQTPCFPLPATLMDHPRYRVLQLLGTGGMGAVYKA